MPDEVTPPEPPKPPETPPAPPPEPPPPANPNDAAAKARIAEKRAKEAEEKLAEATKKIEEHERSKLTEQERVAKDLADLKPKADKVAAYEKSIGEILDIEVAGVPEDKRDLIPALDPIERLKWVRNAKEKGLFAPPAAPVVPPKPPTTNGAPSGTPTDGDAVKAVSASAKKGGMPGLLSHMRKLGRG